MSVFQKRADLLDDLEFKLGRERGRLAASMDILTDLAALLGTHVAYCRAEKTATRPMGDMLQAMEHVGHVKELISSILARESAP
jgi:hypothetical protein